MSHRQPPRSWPALLIAIAIAMLTSSAIAQPALSANLSPTVYRLAPSSAFMRGCFPPCLCPTVFIGNPRGTFLVTPAASIANLPTFRIDEVNWLVSTGNIEWRITGSGTLTLAGGPATNAQRLELDLKINDEPIAHFDSGWVAASEYFPVIDLTVTMNGGVCYDTEIRVVASPVPRHHLLRYKTLPGATFQQGCFPPCACPLQPPQALAGTFTLVPIFGLPALAPTEFAVVNARFGVSTLASTTVSRTAYVGSGFYRRNFSAAATSHRMFLDLRGSNAGAVERFDSGLVPAANAFPNIDITMSMNGMVCFDKVIRLLAAPVNATPQPTP